jgi:serine/threonine protein kinase
MKTSGHQEESGRDYQKQTTDSSASILNSSEMIAATTMDTATTTTRAETQYVIASSNSANVDKLNSNVAVSHQQQQEVYSILAMLQTATTTNTNNDNKSHDNTITNEQQDDFDGEYNSGDEDGRVLPPEDNNDDEEVVEFSGGLYSRDATASVVANGSTGFDANSEHHSNSKGGLTRLTSASSGLALSSMTKETTTSSASRYYFGKPKQVQSQGTFTELGSVLGPFFCLGQLGKGTFSSIHKCINMDFFHQKPDELSKNTCRRLAAAKVELGSFQQSGVLEAEATILDYLHTTLPPGTVPVYMGHYRSDGFAAIFMEYLSGEDMHQLREYVMAKTVEEYNVASLQRDAKYLSSVSPPTRRINVNDAVYLTAEVMLPLLQRMHEVGVVHRDVKPSNCVRAGTGPNSKQFCMVDFGLSKSIIVPEDSEFADKQHTWDGQHWLKPYVYQNSENPPKGCYREERKKADFRGTSMYASLRVHQCRDYCPRDDVWSLLYVFCDLVSGGLPWMQHAANRDRDTCEKFKERIQAELDADGDNNTEIAELLKGDIYHKALFQREKSIEAGVLEERLPPLPSPLAMCEEKTKIHLLSKAFTHVSKLKFWEKPNYKLIQDCIRGFTRGSNSKDPIIRPINWDTVGPKDSPGRRRQTPNVEWLFVEDIDPISSSADDVFDVSDEALVGNRDDFTSRIPVELRFKIAQMDYNVVVATSSRGKGHAVPLHRALNDWMQVSLGLLFDEWDSKRYEHGGHRSANDGYKRECYLHLLEKCRKYATTFKDFGSSDLLYYSAPSAENGSNASCDVDEQEYQPRAKRRKVAVLSSSSERSSSKPTDLVLVSKCIFGLIAAIKAEQSKKTAPPVRISFG